MTKPAADPPATDWEQVRRDAESATTRGPVSPAEWLRLSQAYSHTGYPNLAQSAREQVLSMGPHGREIYSALYAECRRLGEDDRALEVCRHAVEADPEDHAAYFVMAHTMVALRYPPNYTAAVLENAARLVPDNPVYRLSTAIQLASCSRPEAAYEHLRAAPVASLRRLDCRCSVRRLLAVCVGARDLERSRALSETLHALGEG